MARARPSAPTLASLGPLSGRVIALERSFWSLHEGEGERRVRGERERGRRTGGAAHSSSILSSFAASASEKRSELPAVRQLSSTYRPAARRASEVIFLEVSDQAPIEGSGMRLFSEQRGAIYRANIRGAVYSQREHVELVQISPMVPWKGRRCIPSVGFLGHFPLQEVSRFAG